MEQPEANVPPRTTRRSDTGATGRPIGAIARPSLAETTNMGVSFDEFYAAERDRLARALALIVGDPLIAAELIDEAMVRAFQRWGHVRSLQRPGGWVYRVALNLSTSRFRRLRRDIKYRWLSTPAAPTDATVEAAFRAQIEDDRLLAALLDLPIAQRTVVVARILLDYSEIEVAELVGVRPGTVKSRLSRGLDELRTSLGGNTDGLEPITSGAADRRRAIERQRTTAHQAAAKGSNT